jgi:hypothetical protein
VREALFHFLLPLHWAPPKQPCQSKGQRTRPTLITSSRTI